MPAGAKPRTRFGPIWKWSSMRNEPLNGSELLLLPQPAMCPALEAQTATTSDSTS